MMKVHGDGGGGGVGVFTNECTTVNVSSSYHGFFKFVILSWPFRYPKAFQRKLFCRQLE